MKGMSMTLTIVIVAIVLLVTALVIMTIFGGQMAQILGILNPWSSSMLESSLCQQKCSAWCQQHPGEPDPEWTSILIDRTDADGKPITGENCESVMIKATGGDPGKCKCLGLVRSD